MACSLVSSGLPLCAQVEKESHGRSVVKAEETMAKHQASRSRCLQGNDLVPGCVGAVLAAAEASDDTDALLPSLLLHSLCPGLILDWTGPYTRWG